MLNIILYFIFLIIFFFSCSYFSRRINDIEERSGASWAEYDKMRAPIKELNNTVETYREELCQEIIKFEDKLNEQEDKMKILEEKVYNVIKDNLYDNKRNEK